jgi:ACT domain-containing protein
MLCYTNFEYIAFWQKTKLGGYKIMKAVISVTGKDGVGIVAKVSAKCAECGANIIDISQTVLGGYFAMIMIADVSELNVQFGDFVDYMAAAGNEAGLQINTMHEDIFNSMHKI